MAERLEEQSFDRCDAVPQFFANYELDVFIFLGRKINLTNSRTLVDVECNARDSRYL